MYLNFKKINSAKRDAPMLRLQTLAGKELGPVPFVQGLNFEINYSDLSTIEFKVPYMVNGAINPVYSALTGYKVIYTQELGVYMITNPEKSGDGMSETKLVKGYSLEYTFHKKNLYLEEGTYCFWNPMFPKETVLGRIVELDPNWSVGYVAPRLINCYRTFDKYDNSALNFCYGDVMEKYRCAIVFDVYDKTINAYDAGNDTGSLPIYLDYDNLVKDVKVKEDSENIATKLHVYGGDGLSIRNVNPINGDYLVDLSFFLNNGDLDIVAQGGTEKLSDKVRRWRADVLARQPYYTGLVALRSSMTAKKLTLETQLNELKGQLQAKTADQSVLIEEQAIAETDDGKTNKQKELDNIRIQITSTKGKISDKEDEIRAVQAEIDGYLKKIKSISDTLSINGYFTKAEQLLLAPYLIEGEMAEETFVATDVSNANTATSATLTGKISLEDSEVSRVSLTEFGRTIYTLAGGTLSVPDADLSAQVVRGTVDVSNDNTYTLTAYLGSIRYSGHEFSKGMITVTGKLSDLSNDITKGTENSITQYKGSRLSFHTSGAGLYFTVTANEFQQYAVEMELYAFAADALSDFAWPTYEFDINIANFLYQEKFEPFKNSLELGKSVHLRLGSEGLIHPKIIGVKLDYDDITNFSLIFSNRYQRKDELEYLNDEIHSAAKTSTRFDASKYLYDRTADKMTDVDAYMKNILDAAVQSIKAAAYQSVLIDGAGIHVSSSTDNRCQLRITNGMMAMTDDGWETAKLAIGRFYSKEHKKNLYGINAEWIAGNLIVGNNLYIKAGDGDGFFSVDNEGVHIDSAKFIITHKNSEKSLSDTLNGINSDISNVSTSVTNLSNDFSSVTIKTDSGICLNASDLSGVINAMQSKMQSGSGNVLFDSDGIWLMNETQKSKTTKAVWMNENGILFGTGAAQENPGASNSGWEWTTAIGHDGITADALRSKTLNAVTIVGGKITIGKGSESDKTYLHVDEDGNLGIGRNTSKTKGYNFYVDHEGNMYATSGEFGGKLVAATGTFSGSLSAATGTFSGNLSAASGTFSGTLNAAKIKGKLEAESGAEIIGPAIYVPSKELPNFKVDSNGDVTMNGSIKMGGNITWGASNSPVKVLYAPVWFDKPKNSYDSYPDGSNKFDRDYDWHKTFYESDYWASYSYDGGLTWTDPIKLQGKDGENGKNGENGSNAEVTRANIVRAMLESIDQDGLYTTTIDGRQCLGINASAIRTGTIDAGEVYLADGYGGFCSGRGFDGIDDTYGAKMYGSGGDNYVIATNGGTRMTAGTKDIYVTSKGCYSSEEFTRGSDRRIKNSITYDMDKYSRFFMKLQPTAFRLNNGNSGRYHIGFIAQDVEQALLDSGVSTNDFAGFVRSAGLNDVHGEYEDQCYLRYDNFIALNTFMIQKLYKRIEELESKINSMN